jgi:hypothetical protein
MDNNRSGIPTGDPRAETAAPSWTPGPWHVSSTHLAAAYDIGAENGANIARVSGPTENGAEEFRANARLIAAAPDLYEALKRCVEYFDIRYARRLPGQNDDYCDNVDRVNAALAKARGERT